MNYYEETDLNLNIIDDIFLKRLTTAFIKEKVPKYFFEIPASSSGKYHPSFDAGYEGAVRHTNMCLEVAQELLRLSDYENVDKDKVFVSLIVHDTYKNGYTDSGHTVAAHPDIAALEFKLFALNFLKKYTSKNPEFFDYPKYQGTILDIAYAIKTHMGDWGDSTPETPLEKVVFLSDYIASRKFFDKYFSSTPENLEKAFRIQDRKYHIYDAIYHCDELYPDIEFSDEEYDLLAEKFEDEHDCNVADNDTWDNVIKEYVRQNKEG